MGDYSPGDILWRRGTVGVQKDPIDHPVVVVAVNRQETLGGKPIYICATVTNNPQGRAGSVPFSEGVGTKYANLSQLLIAGHDTFRPAKHGGDPLLHQLNSGDMARLRSTIDSVLVPSGALLGRIVYSATPSHDGSRGKPHRPYALVGEVGKGSQVYLSVPVSSSPSSTGNGATIKDLEAAGLLRSEGEASHTRLAWTATLDARTASKEAGRLSDGDRQVLFGQFKSFKKMLMEGEIVSTRKHGEEPVVAEEKKTCLFPGGLGGTGLTSENRNPALAGRGSVDPRDSGR